MCNIPNHSQVGRGWRRKTKGAFAFSVFSFRGVWGYSPPEKFENEMLRNAVSGHFCDIFVKKFSSLHPIFTCQQYQWN